MSPRLKSAGLIGTAMEDLSAFASAHPEFCEPTSVRVPGHGSLPAIDGARPFPLTADQLESYRAEVPKDPATLPAMLKIGPEAVAFYVSFRLAPDRWGIFVREGALRALKEEYHRIIWRDLGKYADRNVDVSLEAYAAQRAANVEVLSRLSDAEWERRFRHPEFGRQSLRTLARHISDHDLAHLRQIRG